MNYFKIGDKIWISRFETHETTLTECTAFYYKTALMGDAKAMWKHPPQLTRQESLDYMIKKLQAIRDEEQSQPAVVLPFEVKNEN